MHSRIEGFGIAILFGFGLAIAALAAVAETAPRPPRNAAEVIRGYGGADGLTRAQIADYIALTRGQARGRLLGRLLQADLNWDGAIDRGEAATYAAPLSARSRARFAALFEEADADEDGGVSASEFTLAGERAAQLALDAGDEAGLYLLLDFDRDGNKAVSLDELRDGLAAAKAPQTPAKPQKDV